MHYIMESHSQQRTEQQRGIDDGENDEYLAIGILIFVVIAGIFVAVYYKWKLDQHMTSEALGQRGDFFGGIINPIIGLATIILIIITIRIQRRELKASINELKISNEAISKQAFENSFFSWLSSYHKLLESVQVTVFSEDPSGPDTTLEGRHAMRRMYINHFSAGQLLKKDRAASRRQIRDIPRRPYNNSTPIDARFFDSWPPEEVERAISIALEGYVSVFDRHRYQFDGLYRTLFRLIGWIDTHKRLEPDEKWFYVAIVRAQLSWIEMVFLLYNCMTPWGAAFVEYANKYALFDNLGIDADALLILISTRADRYGLSKAAFNSDAARMKMKQQSSDAALKTPK